MFYLPSLFARRYLFSKKSTNAINIISGISVLGITLGSMSLIVILSVFNGFEDLIGQLTSSLRPDLQVTAQEGKVFKLEEGKLQALRELPELRLVSEVLEEIALFEYNGLNNLGRIKGVDKQYVDLGRLDTLVQQGEYKIEAEGLSYGVAGSTLEYTLGLSLQALKTQPIKVYMPKRLGKLGKGQPFVLREVYPAGFYSLKQVDFDNYLITNLALVQDLLSYEEGEISALELGLKPGVSVAQAKRAVQAILGEGFVIKDRFEQDEAFYKISNLEKWVGYLIFSFTLLLVAFNMVGALWMLVLEKRRDILTLLALGAEPRLIRQIFLAEGLWLSLIGLVLGCMLAVGLCLAQQHIGLVTLEGSGDFITDRYPVSMRVGDFILVSLTVLGIGGLAALLPAWRAGKIEGVPTE